MKFFSKYMKRSKKFWIDVTSSTQKNSVFITASLFIHLIWFDQVKAIDFFEVQFLYLYFKECKLKNK